jgi:hypothetical protein
LELASRSRPRPAPLRRTAPPASRPSRPSVVLVARATVSQDLSLRTLPQADRQRAAHSAIARTRAGRDLESDASRAPEYPDRDHHPPHQPAAMGLRPAHPGITGPPRRSESACTRRFAAYLRGRQPGLSVPVRGRTPDSVRVARRPGISVRATRARRGCLSVQSMLAGLNSSRPARSCPWIPAPALSAICP